MPNDNFAKKRFSYTTICMFGYTDSSAKLAESINSTNTEAKVICYCDNNCAKHSSAEDDVIPVLSVDEAHKRLLAGRLDGFCIPYSERYASRLRMINQLRACGIDSRRIFVVSKTSVEDCGENIVMQNIYDDSMQSHAKYIPPSGSPPEQLKLVIFIQNVNDFMSIYTRDIIDTFFTNVKFCGYCSENMNQVGDSMQDGEIISFYEAKRWYDKGEIDGILVYSEIEAQPYSKLIERIRATGIDAIYVVPLIMFRKEALDRGLLDQFIIRYEDNIQINKLDFSIAEHCNLKCQGCSHFSSIVREERFTNISSFHNDLIRLKELLGDNVRNLNLLGGEPLLHKELGRFVISAHTIFPYADVRIFTNGLLVLQMSDALINAIQESRAIIMISRYPAVTGKIDEVHRFLKKLNIRHRIGGEVQNFYSRMNLHGENDKEDSYNACFSKTCTYVVNGKIASCYLPLTIQYFNEYFGVNLPDGDVLDIHDPDLTAKNIIRFLWTPNDLCRYCNSANYTMKKWARVEKEAVIEAWLAENGYGAKNLKNND